MIGLKDEVIEDPFSPTTQEFATCEVEPALSSAAIELQRERVMRFIRHPNHGFEYFRAMNDC